MPSEYFIFDLDGTLAPFDSDELYPDAKEWLEQNGYDNVAVATNQGGVGLRHWMEKDKFGDPDKYPTKSKVSDRINRLFPGRQGPVIAVNFRYQAKKTGQWGPVPEGEELSDAWRQDWRKPAPGMLLKIMDIWRASPQQITVIGDDKTDQQAAEAAGCKFEWAHEFFGRVQPEEFEK